MAERVRTKKAGAASGEKQRGASAEEASVEIDTSTAIGNLPPIRPYRGTQTGTGKKMKPLRVKKSKPRDRFSKLFAEFETKPAPEKKKKRRVADEDEEETRFSVIRERMRLQVETPEQIRAMCELLSESIAGGGLGLSSSKGPLHHDGDGNPVPSRAAARDELLSLAGALRDHPGTTIELILAGALSEFSDDETDLMTSMSLAADRPINWNVLGLSAANREHAFRQLRASDHAAAHGARVVALTLPHGTRISRHEERHLSGATRTILADRGFLLFLGAVLIGGSIYMQNVSTFALHVRDAGYSNAVYGGLQALNGLIVVFLELPIAAWTGRRSRTGMVALGSLLIGSAFASLTVTQPC